MSTLATFLKVLLACTLIWSGIYMLTMGLLTTMIVLSVFLLVFSLACLFAGIWLALNLLKRNSDNWLRIGLVVLVPLGLAALYSLLNGITWVKGF